MNTVARLGNRHGISGLALRKLARVVVLLSEVEQREVNLTKRKVGNALKKVKAEDVQIQ